MPYGKIKNPSFEIKGTRVWPPIRKTGKMQELEHLYAHEQPDGSLMIVDIRDIILQFMRHYATDAEASTALGLSQSALSHWISRLGIMGEADGIRELR